MKSLIIMDDKNKLHELKKGNAKAWNIMVDKYSKTIYNMTFNFTGNRDEAADLTQDVFLKIYNNIHKFKEEKNFASWIMRLCKNHCIDYWRKKKRSADIIEFEDSHEKTEYTPEDSTFKEIDNHLLRQKLQLLNNESRLLIIMRDIQDCSYQEIADHFNIPIGTTKSRINRARAKLARLFINEGY